GHGRIPADVVLVPVGVGEVALITAGGTGGVVVPGIALRAEGELELHRAGAAGLEAAEDAGEDLEVVVAEARRVRDRLRAAGRRLVGGEDVVIVARERTADRQARDRVLDAAGHERVGDLVPDAVLRGVRGRVRGRPPVRAEAAALRSAAR